MRYATIMKVSDMGFWAMKNMRLLGNPIAYTNVVKNSGLKQSFSLTVAEV